MLKAPCTDAICRGARLSQKRPRPRDYELRKMNDRNGVTLHEIEIGIVVPAVIYAPVWLADQRGFLRDEGLTVRLRSFGSTDGTTAALRDGIVPITNRVS